MSPYNEGVVTDIIVKALERPGWNQARLARALDVRPQTVNKWVKGENRPPIERWSDLEQALELRQGTILDAVRGQLDVDALEAKPKGKARVDFNSRIARLSPEDQKYIDDLVERLLREHDG